MNFPDKTVKEILYFLTPDIDRGPAISEWVELMREITKAMNLPVCPSCNAKEYFDPDVCCSACLDVGRKWK